MREFPQCFPELRGKCFQNHYLTNPSWQECYLTLAEPKKKLWLALLIVSIPATCDRRRRRCKTSSPVHRQISSASADSMHPCCGISGTQRLNPEAPSFSLPLS